MARSAEENRRLVEEHQRELKLPWMTNGEFDRLSERQQSRELQKLTRHVTSYLGFWKTCSLSSCRRARACRGFLTEAQYCAEPRYHSSFPPCVGPGGARQPEVLKNWRAAFGVAPDDTDEPKYDGRRSADAEP
jgi:hypothetical protein